MSRKIDFFHSFRRVNWMDVYFVVITILYVLWRAKVILERVNG